MQQIKSTTIKEGVMKKLLLGITVLALVLFTSSAMAAGLKVPKTLCLSHSYWTDHYDKLAFKSISNVPTSSGNAKIYAMHGFANSGGYSGPVFGTGYVVPGGTVLHVSYSGQGGSSLHRQRSFELFFDLATNTGTLYYTFYYVDGTTILSDSESVALADCASQPMPSVMVSGTFNQPEGE
jgi:hypothetical protein